MKFENGSWQSVGDMLYMPGSVNPFISASLVFSSNNIPYLAYRDFPNSVVTVKKFENGIWENVGIGTVSSEWSGRCVLALDNNDVPYVFYAEGSDSGKAIVKKFENGNWSTVGDEAGIFVTNSSYQNALFIDSNNIPYIAYRSSITLSPYVPVAVFKKYINNEWQQVEELVFLEGPGAMSFGLYNNILYIAHTDWENDNKATVKKFENDSWQAVGEAGFSQSIAHNIKLAININGIPYVAFRDFLNDHRISVMKYDSTMDIDNNIMLNKVLLYPNPANHFVTISGIPENSTVNIIDITGKLIYHKQANEQLIIDISDFINGVYLVQITTDNQQKINKKLLINR